jgi:TatD DNase family protein
MDISPLKYSLLTFLEHQLHGKFPENVNFSNNICVNHAILPGISVESSKKCIEIAQMTDTYYASVAIHPNSIMESSKEDWEKITALSSHPKVAAIGETGLDRHWNTTPFELQIDYFQRHLNLARERDLPVLIHCRDCDEDMIFVLNKQPQPLHGVLHSFSSTKETAEIFLNMGLYISFSGTVTYTNKKTAPLWEAAKIVPDDRLLLETDAPFLVPHPYRGKIPFNEPVMTAFVARRLAELRHQPLEHIADITTENAKRLFRIT